jgi:transposase
MEIDPQNLPEDPAALRQIVLSLLQIVDDKQQELERVRHMLQQLLRWRYGQKRERVDPNQLFLFAAEIVNSGRDQAAIAPSEGAAPAPPASSPKSPRKRQGHGRQQLPQTLERRRVVYDLEAHQRQCPLCQSQLERIGEEISERLEYVPASFLVIEEACQKYACTKGCTVVTAGKPMAPIEKGLPGPGLLAHVATSKYGDHIPLHRQEQIYQRHGVDLSRQTMCDWMRGCTHLVEPMYELMKEQVLGSKAVQTDDTPVPGQDPTLPRTRTGRIWTYVGDERHPYTVYDYTPNRSRSGPDAFLKEFHGYLQADAYSGYDALYQDAARGIVEVACWAHARRYHFEAQTSDPMRATVMLAFIHLLYEVEREARQHGWRSEQRRELRQAKSMPILEDIKIYLQAEQAKVLPKSPIGQAIAYTLSNWAALIRYCEDGDLEIDNTGAERTMRGIAVGRRNWMFYGSDNGGRTAAVLTSFVASCKRHGIDPFEYLRDVSARISAHPRDRLEELLPDKWQAARAAARPEDSA